MTIDQGRIVAELPRLRRYAQRLTRNVVDADDLVHDTILLVLRKQHRYIEGDLRAWMLTIMHNHYVSSVRLSARLVTVTLNEDIPSHSNADASVLVREVVEEIKRLPSTRRYLIEQIAVGGASYNEVARCKQCPVGSVRSRLSRARKRLREFVSDRV